MNPTEQQILSRLPPRVRQIVVETAEEHGVRIYQMFSPTRRTHVARARWAAMYKVKAGNPDLSAPRVGEWFGRNHTTVLHGWARHSDLTGAPRVTTAYRTK